MHLFQSLLEVVLISFENIIIHWGCKFFADEFHEIHENWAPTKYNDFTVSILTRFGIFCHFR